MRNTGALQARPVSEELISPKTYISLSKSDKAKIKSAEIVPPKLGGKDFGKLLVRYKTPVYKVG